MNFPQRHGPWQILARTEVYRDPWIALDRDDVIRPDGKPGTHCVVRLKPGVSVLPLDDRGMVYLTEEFHYGVGRLTIEAVSGGIEPGEDPLDCARRELLEELGISAGEWIDLGVCDPFTSVVVSPTRLFLARQLTFGPTMLEGTEQIRCLSVSLAEAVQMVLDSRLTHAPSGLLILKASEVVGSG
jgi:ADP-ribose diphosphatase